MTTTEISSAYTVYSAPAIVTVLVGGVVVDSIGVFRSFVAFYCILLCGVVLLIGAVYAFPSFSASYGLLLVAGLDRTTGDSSAQP